MEDLKKGVLRLIGEPTQRYREDPVRILRAVRFAGKLGFKLHPDTAAPIPEMKLLLQYVSSARLLEEVFKLFLGGYSQETYRLLREYNLLEHLFAITDHYLKYENDPIAEKMLALAFQNTDVRIAEHKSVNPAFIFSALLWYPVVKNVEKYKLQSYPISVAWETAVNETIRDQVRQTAIPKRLTMTMREIWSLQRRLIHPTAKNCYRNFEHPKFRAAYDFLLLRQSAGENLQEICDWWTRFQDVEVEERKQMVALLPRSGKRNKFKGTYKN
jgi:poly(A) polymerase